MKRSVAIAHPNIALVKYWGKRDIALNLPAVSSLSLTLSGYSTTTEVGWGAERDRVWLEDAPADAATSARVLRFLDRIDPNRPPVEVRSVNNFPTGAGLASSSSAFAALAAAGCHAAGLQRTPRELSVLARQGSGSASRSLFGGFSVWHRGERDDGSDSFAEPLAAEDHWDLSMVVAVVSAEKKSVGSTEGMERSRATSAFYDSWVRTAQADVDEGIAAVKARDLDRLGAVMEASTFKMHAVMQTSVPPILYWRPSTVACLEAVVALRSQGVSAWATMDAGPNVKILCAPTDAPRVAAALSPLVATVTTLGPGGPTRVESL